MRIKISMAALALCAAALTAAPARAADLKDCTARALAYSPAVKAYERQLASAQAAADRDGKARLPRLSASADDGYSAYSAASGLEDGLTGTLGLQLDWDLPKALSGYQRLADLETRKSRLLLETARRTLARDVAKDYYRLHILAAKKADYDGARSYFTSHIADIEELGDRGVDVKLDLLRAGMQLRALGVAEAAIETDLRAALLSLNSATGGGFREGDFAFADIPAPARAAAPAGAAAAAPETRLNALDQASAEEAYRQSGYFYAPALAFGVNKAVTPIDPATERSRAFLSLSLPVFDFGQHAADRRALREDAEYRRQLALEERRRLEVSIRTLTAGMDNAAAACADAGAGLADADKALRTAGEYYRQGKIRETDLLSVFADYLAAKEQARDALGDYLDKKADLDYYAEGL